MQKVMSEWLGTERDFHLHMTDGTTIPITSDSPKSTDLVLGGLLSCSGRTLLLILDRMRLKVAGLKVWATCEREVEPPKIFTRVDLFYEIDLGSAPADRVRRALELTEKHCTVLNILNRATAVHLHVTLLEGEQGREV